MANDNQKNKMYLCQNFVDCIQTFAKIELTEMQKHAILREAQIFANLVISEYFNKIQEATAEIRKELKEIN